MASFAIALSVIIVAVAAALAVFLLRRGVRWRVAPLLPLAVFVIAGVVDQEVMQRTGPKWIALWIVVAISLYLSILMTGSLIRVFLDEHHIQW